MNQFNMQGSPRSQFNQRSFPHSQYGIQGPSGQNYEDFQYQISGTNLDVDEIRRRLADYGINNIHENKNGNMSTLTVKVQNPNESQLEGIRNVILPVDRRLLQPMVSEFRQLNQSLRLPFQELQSQLPYI